MSSRGEALFYDDTRIDEGLADAGDHQPEPEPPAVLDARRIRRLTAWQSGRSPTPAHSTHQSFQTSPRPPHPAHVRRTRHAQGNDRAPERFLRRDDDVGPDSSRRSRRRTTGAFCRAP